MSDISFVHESINVKHCKTHGPFFKRRKYAADEIFGVKGYTYTVMLQASEARDLKNFHYENEKLRDGSSLAANSRV